MNVSHTVICRVQPLVSQMAQRCWTRAALMNGSLIWDWRDQAPGTFGTIWASLWEEMRSETFRNPKPRPLTVTNRLFDDVARDPDALTQSPRGYGSIICPVGDGSPEWALIAAPQMEVLGTYRVGSNREAVLFHQSLVGMEPDNSEAPYVKGFLIRPDWRAVDLTPTQAVEPVVQQKRGKATKAA